MDKPLISVIVPVYKVENFLDECIRSIVNQTYRNLEIILVDDGSPDHSPEICEAWARRDSRIKVIHQQNAGVSAARNKGLDIARGELFGFVDSDDYIAETMFEDLQCALQHSEKKIAVCSTYRVLMNGSVLQQPMDSHELELSIPDAVSAMFYGTINVAVWNKLYERSVFEQIRFPENERNEDLPIFIPLITNAGGVVLVGKSLYYYRETPNSLSTSYLQEEHSAIVYTNLNRMAKQIREYGVPCERGYRYFAAWYSFSNALSMEKKYNQISVKVKEDYAVYRGIMKKYIFSYVFSSYSKVKHKILYLLVLTRLLRPMYRLFYWKHKDET